MKQEILDRLNEIIVEEKGSPVTMKSMFKDADLDSLGTMLTLVTLESDYPFMGEYSEEVDALKNLDIENLTIRELIKKCVLSKTSASTEPKNETVS